MILVGENAGRHIADFSAQFQMSLSHFSLAGISLLPSILGDFLVIFFKRFGTKRVKANNVYQEYIQDKNHLHMNATRWVTLTEFI